MAASYPICHEAFQNSQAPSSSAFPSCGVRPADLPPAQGISPPPAWVFLPVAILLIAAVWFVSKMAGLAEK